MGSQVRLIRHVSITLSNAVGFITMPDEDGLPSYEDVTGIQRLMPQNVSRQITRSVRNSKNGSSSSSCFSTLLFPLLIWGPFLILAIFMISIGHANRYVCPHSWLPIWLMIGGSLTLIIDTICLLIFLVVYFKKEEDEENPKTHKGMNILLTLAAFLLLVNLIWYAMGCYWTWKHVDNIRTITRRIWLGYSEARWWRHARVAACDGPVLWFSLFVTIFPFIWFTFTCGFLCWRGCKNNPDNGVTGRQNPSIEETGELNHN